MKYIHYRGYLIGHHAGSYQIYLNKALIRTTLTLGEAKRWIDNQVTHNPSINISSSTDGWIPAHAIRKTPSGEIEILVEKGTLSNPKRKKKILGMVRKLFSANGSRGRNPEPIRIPKGTGGMRTYDVYWGPEGRKIATVRAKTMKAAKRKAPQPYRKYLGEIYVQEVDPGNWFK